MLIVSSYIWDPQYLHLHKLARRFAVALAPWLAKAGDRVEIRARLHPLDDRARWPECFPPGLAPGLTDAERLSTNLAWADVVIGTPSSTYIEALLYDVPVLLHSGQVEEASAIFAEIPEQRRFRTGDELMERIEPLLREPDTSPERALRERCFGPGGQPRNLVAFVRELLASAATGDPSATTRSGSAPATG